MRWLLSLIIFFRFGCMAQNRGAPSATWYFSGISYQVSRSTEIWGHFGINNDQAIKAVYLQSFIRIHKNITLNPSYLYLAIDSDAGGSKEHTFMNAVYIHVPLTKFLLDDRNMLWNWIRKDAEDLYLYRNRLRLSLPFKLASLNGRIYTFDEVTFSFNRNEWSRNRLGVGFVYDVISRVNIDAFYARQNDTSSGGLNLFLIMGTIQF